MAAPESIEAALRDLMARDNTLSEIIQGRIYPVMVPADGKYPCAVYRRISTGREQHTLGATGVITPVFEFRFWSYDYDQTKAMFDAFRRIVDGLRTSKRVGNSTFYLRRCFIAPPGEHDDFDQSAYGDGRDIYCSVVPLGIDQTELTVSNIEYLTDDQGAFLLAG